MQHALKIAKPVNIGILHKDRMSGKYYCIQGLFCRLRIT
jgi:hypothetical protein